MAAIPYFHRAANEASPTAEESVKAVLAHPADRGRPPVRKKAATSDIVIAMAAEGRSLRGSATVRCCCSALRAPSGAPSSWRSMFEDIEETPEGLLIHIRRGKTDQEGLGRKVAIPRGDIACPVEALRAWREAAGIEPRRPVSHGCGT